MTSRSPEAQLQQDIAEARESQVYICQYAGKPLTRQGALEEVDRQIQSIKEHSLLSGNQPSKGGTAALEALHSVRKQVEGIDISQAHTKPALNIGVAYSQECAVLEKAVRREKAQIARDQGRLADMEKVFEKYS